MAEAIRKVNVIGHLHPDTDSICSAISYAYLKNQISEPIYEARRAGAINRETAFVLKHFGFEEPPLITTVTPQIKDIKITPLPGIDAETIRGLARQMAANRTQTKRLERFVLLTIGATSRALLLCAISPMPTWIFSILRF